MYPAAHPDIEAQPVRVVRPSAARAIKAAVLMVHHEQRVETVDRVARLLQHTRDAPRGAPAGSRMVVVVAREAAVRDRTATERGCPQHRTEHPLRRIVAVLGP